MTKIGSENVRAIASAREVRTILQPATGGVIEVVADSTPAEVDAAVTAAGRALEEWAATTPRERSERLHLLADRVARDADALADLESRNVGKPRAMARDEVDYSVDNLRFFAAAARCLRGEPSGEYLAGYTSSLRRDPVGVVGLITPWNYPLMMAVWKLGPALAAGNSCVLKPAEHTPLTTLRLVELAREVLPEGVVNVVTGDGAVGSALAAHAGVAMVSVTGSVATGRAVAHAAADRVGRVHLELGGNAPVLVFDDADLDAVVQGIRTAGYWNAGQECAAACRVIATDGIYDRLRDALVSAVASIQVGSPDSPESEMGPLISSEHRERVLGFLNRARGVGAEVLVGGEPYDPGFFVTPAVVASVEQESEIVQSEVFGPVVTVQRAADESQALRWASDVEQGLSASVWTRDLERAHRCIRALRFGTVWVNDHLALVSEMPWTGFGQSGHGYDQSVRAVEDYTQYKHVMVRA